MEIKPFTIRQWAAGLVLIVLGGLLMEIDNFGYKILASLPFWITYLLILNLNLSKKE